ncbi:hypothetical protein P20652_2896 [Pseudoalteromonas sp. BSi20652]|nr:hypothetical protein P20652_2896 [Pseudoalteromonas sp. BSi20652]
MPTGLTVFWFDFLHEKVFLCGILNLYPSSIYHPEVVIIGAIDKKFNEI